MKRWQFSIFLILLITIYNEYMLKNCSVIILAAGRSSRMGKIKIGLKTKSGVSFLESIVNQYIAFGVYQVVVVLNEDGLLFLKSSSIKQIDKITFVKNEYPELKRFYSLKLGISSLKTVDFVFIHNVDNPYADESTLSKIFSKKHEADWIKPIVLNKGGHPILISNKIVIAIIEQTDLNIQINHFLKRFSCKQVEVEDEKILLNINTIEDYNNL